MQGLGKQLTLHEGSKEVNVKPRFSKISLALDIENSKLLNPKPCADDCLALKANFNNIFSDHVQQLFVNMASIDS